jgi:hypothetical protein
MNAFDKIDKLNGNQKIQKVGHRIIDDNILREKGYFYTYNSSNQYKIASLEVNTISEPTDQSKLDFPTCSMPLDPPLLFISATILLDEL